VREIAFVERMQHAQPSGDQYAHDCEANCHRQAMLRLTISLLQSQDEERRRFERNLHDSIGQYLTIIKMDLDAMNGLGRDEQRYREEHWKH
jgi:signal transduction histidine kinase